MVKQNNSSDEVSWNLSQLFINEIGNLLNEASRNYVNRNYSKSFDDLKAVSMRVVAYLNEEEIEKLDKLEKNFYKNSNNTIKNGFEKPTIKILKALKLQLYYYTEYNNCLLKLLRKYGLLIPLKEDTTEMSA